MRPCPKCGAVVANDASKCAECGEVLEDGTPITSELTEVKDAGDETSATEEYAPPPVNIFRMGLFTFLVVVVPYIAFSIGGTAVAFAAWFVGLLVFFAVEQLTH